MVLSMSKAFIAGVLQESAQLTGVAANQAASDLLAAIVREMKKAGKFTLPSFGTFTVRKTKARMGSNPRTGEKIKVKAGKTVRFKASPSLKQSVYPRDESPVVSRQTSVRNCLGGLCIVDF